MRWLNSTLVFITICSADAAYVVTQSGRQINGSKISATADGSVTLTTAAGQSMTFRKGQYKQAAADKPPELTQAEKFLKAGNEMKALPLLKRVKADYRFLAWDQTAALLLANYYFETGQFPEAAAAFQALEHPDATAQSRHREALLKSGNMEAILPMIGTDISSGSREAAARAYLMRGDLKAAQDDLSGARRDWLKVATFFKAQKELAQEAEQKLGENG